MKFDGETFTHSTLEEGYEFTIFDRWKKKRLFKISTFPCPGGLLSEAIEVVENSNGDSEPYQFSIISPFDADAEHAELQLKAKIKRGINKKYLEKHDGRLAIGEHNEIAGRIVWDRVVDDGSMTVAVDGKRLTKKQFWELLDSYEGWQFRLEIFDGTDELEK